MRYEEIRCRVCGGTLKKLGEGSYCCNYCRALWERDNLDDYMEQVRASVRGEVTEALLMQQQERIANIRHNLHRVVHQRNIDGNAVKHYCEELKKYLPEDLQAEFYSLAWDDAGEVNRFLDGVDVKKAGKWLIRDMIDYTRDPLRMENLSSLRCLVERAFQDDPALQELYDTHLDEDEKMNRDGVYNETKSRDVFLAYKSEDIKIVNELCDYLERNGLECFLATRNLKHGRDARNLYEERLKRAIDNCRVVVFISTQLSRTMGNALEIEFPYIKEIDRQNAPAEYKNMKYSQIPAKYKKPRVEYLVEPYRTGVGSEEDVRSFFTGFTYRRQPETVCKAVKEFLGENDDEDIPWTQAAAAPAVKYCLSCGAGNVLTAIFCNQCGKREFGTKDEYEERQKELERLETEQKEAECKEDERKEAECRDASQKKVEKTKEASAASKAEAKAIPAASSDPADFEIEDGVLKKYRGNGGNVVIPNGVTSIGSLVFSIFQGSEPFRDCSSLTSITIPKGVTWIGDRAFCDCSGQTSITIPNSVTRIGMAAFFGCSSLTSITIPKSVTSIGDSAFSGCSSLTSITIPSSVTSIGDCAVEVIHKIKGNAFEGCESLEEIKVENGNSVYHSEGNCLIETESETLVAGCKNSMIPTDGSVTSIGYRAFKDCSSLTSITIPNSVTRIGMAAFFGCSSLTSITIPKSVTSIGDSAFSGCSGLTSITIPKGVTSIEGYAFCDCSGLTSITIPKSVTSIEGYAFCDCSGLTSITIPKSVTSIEESAFIDCNSLEEIKVEKGNPVYHSEGNCLIETENEILVAGCKNSRIPTDGSVTSIGDCAFYGCSGLTRIDIPNSVTSIGWEAFECCSGLTSIAIPKSVTSIEGSAFGGCESLEEIKVENGNPVYHSEGNCLIETESKTLAVGCKNSRIPTDGSVACIGAYAFYGCSGLTSITIPNSVTSIGDMAFYHCSSLTRITIPKSVTSIGRSVFFGCKGLEAIKAEKGNPVYHSEGNCLIETESKTLVVGCKNSRIPTDGSVTSIGYMAFRSCSGLTSITIPNSVMHIGLMSFYGCNGLTSIVIPRNVTSIGRGAFDNCREDLKIYCHDKKPLKWPKGWDVSLKDRIIWDE